MIFPLRPYPAQAKANPAAYAQQKQQLLEVKGKLKIQTGTFLTFDAWLILKKPFSGGDIVKISSRKKAKNNCR
jgi:hypothetical protein